MRKAQEKVRFLFQRFILLMSLMLVLSVGFWGLLDSAAAAPVQLVAGSASSGGANYMIMAGWAEIINRYTQHQVIVEATGGPQANIRLMKQGDAQIGVISMSIAGPAFEGKGWAKGEKYDNIRTMFGMHEAFMDGVALKSSGIKTFYDLENKKVSVGPAGGTPALAVPAILDVLGVNAQIVHLGQGDSINAIKNGQLDAAVFFGGVPRPAYLELQASHPVKFLHLDEASLQKVIELNPYYRIGTIPASAYEYLDEDTKTLSDRYAYAVDKAIDEQVVYEIVKCTLINLDELKEVHEGLRILELNTESLLGGVVIPLHPGAVKAYRELGLDVPEILLPMEMR